MHQRLKILEQVPFLPIAERELRVAARQKKTWWRRVYTTGVGLLVFLFIYLASRRYLTPARFGREVFGILTGFGMAYSLLSGPMATVDCLSRERREGTLGLLYLTDLKSYEIVLGKMAAASVDLLFSLAAALPLIAMTFLMGGVNIGQFIATSLFLVNVMFLSLSVGVCSSAFFVSGRSALSAVLLVLLFLTFGLPLLGEEVLHIRTGSFAATWFYMVCPLYSMQFVYNGVTAWRSWQTWVNPSGVNLLAWGLLFAACLKTRNAWREMPASRWQVLWESLSERFEQWTRGSERRRKSWREHMLARNPIAWMEGRERLQEIVLWGIFLVTTGFWLEEHFLNSRGSNREPVFWATIAHYLLCLWIAIQSPRRLGDDKQSGALELLLSTPHKPVEIIQGVGMILRRRFGRIFGAMIVFDAYLYFVFSNEAHWSEESVLLGCCAFIVFPIQAYSFARVGIYEGLAQGQSLRATFLLIAKLGLFPWVVFLGCLLSWDQLGQHVRGIPPINDRVGYGCWIVSHVVVCLLFLMHANRQLTRVFRTLAVASTRSGGIRWLKRAKENATEAFGGRSGEDYLRRNNAEAD